MRSHPAIPALSTARAPKLDVPENIYRNAATSFVAEFVGAMNRITTKLQKAARSTCSARD